MEGITILEMAQRLTTSSKPVSSAAVSKRLRTAGIKPFRYIGSTGLYKEEDFIAIRDAGTRGRPKASASVSKPASKTKTAVKAKPKKPSKKT